MPEKDVMSSEEYKQVVQLIKETEKDFNDIKKTVLDLVTNSYNLKEEVINAVMVIPSIPEDTTPDSVTMTQIKNVIDQYRTDDKETTWTDTEYLSAFDAAKNASNVIKSGEKELQAMRQDASDIVSGYIAYMSSPEAAKSRKDKLEAMKAAYELETDEYSKKKMKEKIDDLEATMDFSFIFDRIEKLGKSEIDSIVKTFFNKQRGSYIIEKYVNKIHLFKFDTGIYKMFFNLEENFLPEKYHDFNNLFLFIYMRYVSYRDPYKKGDFVRVHSITSALARLVYHKFKKDENEEVVSEPWFITDVIEKMLDYFEDYREEFHENNTTRPGHEERVKAEAKHEIQRKTALHKSLKTLGLEDGIDFTKDMTADELQKIYNEKTDELIEAQRADMNKESDITDVSEDNNGNPVIQPKAVVKNESTEESEETTSVPSVFSSEKITNDNINEKMEEYAKDFLKEKNMTNNVVDFKEASEKLMDEIK